MGTFYLYGLVLAFLAVFLLYRQSWLRILALDLRLHLGHCLLAILEVCLNFVSPAWYGGPVVDLVSGHFLSILLDLGLRMYLVGLVPWLGYALGLGSDRTLVPPAETALLHQQGSMVF